MKTEILSILTEALEQEELKNIVDAGAGAYKSYKKIIKDQDQVLLGLHTGDSTEEDPFIPKKEEIDLLLEELAESFSFKQKKFNAEKRREEQKVNQKLKEAVIEELRSLISEEENIGKAFVTFNNLQDKWGKIGEVPSDSFHRIQSEYSRLRESFYYNIKIYKELADHDKKRNQDRKSQIIEQVKLLTKEKSINKQNTQIRELIKEWDNIGMTYEESWNTLREEFWTSARSILNRIDKHYSDLREKSHDNLVKKQELIAKIKTIGEFENKSTGQWRKSADKIVEVQKLWKSIGASENNEAVWKEFRGECDKFYNAKKAFYNQLSSANLLVEEKKNELIRQAEILKESTDWKDSTKAVLRLQSDWKNAGSTNPRKENVLWKTFRSQLDHFFNAKSAFFAGKEDREKENLVKKEGIVKELKEFALSGNIGADVASLREFSSRWQDIGYIPFSKKDSVYNAYKDTLDQKYDQLKLDKSEKTKIRFQNRIGSLMDQKDPAKAIEFEQRKIKTQIQELQSSILQTENNLGFFNTSKSGGGSMLDAVNKKLKRDKEKLDELKSMLCELKKA
ncbi:MAG: hypothetical protein ACI9EV_001376 [Urechidicola sp.]|jgi:hypothetical protein